MRDETSTFGLQSYLVQHHSLYGHEKNDHLSKLVALGPLIGEEMQLNELL